MKPAQTSSLPSNKKPVYAKKWLFLACGLVLIVAAMAGFLFYQTQQQASNNLSLNPGEVAIQPSGFVPATIKVKKGQVITWTNYDTAEHAVVIIGEPNSDLDGSEPLQSDDSFSYSFDKTGTYHYNDQSNSSAFSGTIIVE